MIGTRIYLDVCALCRPFDEQTFLRIQMETIAVNMILEKVKTSEYELIFSPAHLHEIGAIDDNYIRLDLLSILQSLGKLCENKLDKVRNRAEVLIASGLGIADAAHLAFSEENNAEFITCDDRLIKKYEKTLRRVWVGSPIEFCEKEKIR